MKPKQPRAPTTFDDQGYAAHKGHYHDRSGKKFAQKPEHDDHEDHSQMPTEERVEEEAVDIERAKRKKGRRHLSTANTVLTGTGRGLG